MQYFFAILLLDFFAPATFCAWTDPTLTPGSSIIRTVHINELRTAVEGKRSNYGFSAPSWTDSPLTQGVTIIRSLHINELRDKLDDINATYNSVCAATVPATPGWGAITAGVSMIAAPDITQLRSESDKIGACAACCSATCKGTPCLGASGCTNLSGQQANCNTACHYCSGGGCTYITSGQGYGCTAGATSCSGADTCDSSGNCLLNDYSAGADCGGSYYCTSNDRYQYKCNGSGSCNQGTLVQTCGTVAGQCAVTCAPGGAGCSPIAACICANGTTIRCETSCSGGNCATTDWNCDAALIACGYSAYGYGCYNPGSGAYCPVWY